MAVDPFDVYFEMHSVWGARIPKRLQGIKPRVLIALLKLGTAEGVSQGTAASKLGLTQWGVSKISKKLVKEHWVTVRRSESNHRQKLMTTTVRAQKCIAALHLELESALRTSSTAKRRRASRPIQAVAPETLFEIMDRTSQT